jgi:hypothetical protein
MPTYQYLREKCGWQRCGTDTSCDQRRSFFRTGGKLAALPVNRDDEPEGTLPSLAIKNRLAARRLTLRGIGS